MPTVRCAGRPGCAPRTTPTPWSPALADHGHARRRRARLGGVASATWRRRRHPGVRARRGRLPGRPGVPGRLPRGVRGDADVYYAGKAFLCTAVARWVAEEGLWPRRLLRRRAGRRAARRLRRRRGSATTATTSRARAAPGRRRGRRPHHRRLVRRDRAARAAAAATARSPAAGDGPGDRRRRGPHPRVHRDRPRGPEVRLLDRLRRRRSRPYAGCSNACRGCELLGLHSHIGSQIFDTSGFEVAAHRVVGLLAEVRDELGGRAARARPRRRLRHRVHDPGRPVPTPPSWRRG